MVCAKCKRGKPHYSFPWKLKSKNLRCNICSECKREYERRRYAIRKHRKQLEYRRDLFAGLVCASCGESSAACLAFIYLYTGQELHVGTCFDEVVDEAENLACLCQNCAHQIDEWPNEALRSVGSMESSWMILPEPRKGVSPVVTGARPGSQERIHIMRMRYEAGYEIFHPQDITITEK